MTLIQINSEIAKLVHFPLNSRYYRHCPIPAHHQILWPHLCCLRPQVALPHPRLH